MKRLVVLLISFICTSQVVWGQGNEAIVRQAEYVEHLAKVTSGDVVLKEYLRLFFMDRDNLYPETGKTIASLFLEKKDYDRAIQYLDQYYFLLDSDTQKKEVSLSKAKIHLIANQPQLALVDLLQIRNYKSDDQILYYRIFTKLLCDKYDGVSRDLNQVSYLTDTDVNKVNTLISRLKKNKKKNPTTAKVMSAIIPGLGQIVNGEIVDGIKSFALLTGIAIVGVNLAMDIGFLDAALSVGPWYTRYFLGGVGNAAKASETKKISKKQKLISQVVILFEEAAQRK